MTVGKTFVANTLRRHHSEIYELRCRWKRAIPSALPNNTIWAMDFTGRMDESGCQHSIVGVIDHGSRKALALRTLPSRTSIMALRVLLDCIEQFGKPRVLRTDNDLAFTSRWFTLALRMLAIRHQRSALHCPSQNGRIERLFGTLKERLGKLVVADGAQLIDALAEFRFWYNRVRPHQHLTGRTPDECWQGIDPYLNAPIQSRHFCGWHGLLTGYCINDS